MTSSPVVDFERLVEKILPSLGFRNIQRSQRQIERGADFTAELGKNLYAIEAKYYRTSKPQIALLEAALSSLALAVSQIGARGGILVVSCVIPPKLRSILEDQYRITVVDQSELISRSSDDPGIFEDFVALTEFSTAALNSSRADFQPRIDFVQHTESSGAEKDTRGSKLCARLSALAPGRKTWRLYEELCEEALKYLFANDLNGWHKQKWSENGLSRYDYVCRIKPTTDFWQFILQHMNSRYAVFEFKNYSDLIGQSQILTTEKYLYERGLRRIAFVFCRRGADANAIKMTKGAMRENGKLIVLIDDVRLCTMLNMRERGDDPSDYMFEIVDSFLLELGR